MSDGQIDYKQIRAHVEERLEPLKHLRRRRVWLVAHIAAFILINLLLYFDFNLYDMIFQKVNRGIASFYGPPYPLFIVVWVMWLVLLIAHFTSVTTAFRHENLIQREMKQEVEVEKMRLQAELMRYGNVPQAQPALNPDEENEEKPKRKMFLSDDGELVDEASHPRSRSANRP